MQSLVHDIWEDQLQDSQAALLEVSVGTLIISAIGQAEDTFILLAFTTRSLDKS